MSDDFNTAEAIGVLFDLNKLIHKTQSGTAVLKELGDILGIFFEMSPEDDTLSTEILMLIDQRNQAKKDRDFDAADTIRHQLLTQYRIILEDTRDGTRWKRC
jgi:cysteinyl-tRNA synthetase